MHIVELRVERRAFAETLAGLREWIDRNGADPVKFESATEPSGHILVRLDLSTAELAAALRRERVRAAEEKARAAA